ncbi:sensor histidine kinase [Coralloluteibacterium thermophilus]|uniref:Sensor histidine kinase n=1 Tax=Coralloluteibacterium thermophilum TaxID=2707049 RepID=A0ABV9NMN4_9GAMM
MYQRLSHIQLLRFAGLFTWAMVGLPLVYSWYFPEQSTLPARPHDGWLLAAYLPFGAIYWWVTRGLGTRRPGWSDDLFLIALTVSALAVTYLSVSGLGAVLLMVVACVLPWLLPLTIGMVSLIMAHLAVLLLFEKLLALPLFEAAMQSLLYLGFSGFIFVTGWVAKQQAEARDEQRRLNAELRATRALLAESTRLNERTRISRELHDLLGHHLTALSLNLEVAGHLSTGKVQEHVRKSHTLARLLLTDVREAVSHLRGSGAIELTMALRTLAEGVPGLDVRLELPEHFALDDPERAHVLLRCTQEIITNAVRHAEARTLWLRFERRNDALHVQARDDGRGAAQGFSPGNGLRGMRERLRAHGGDLEVVDTQGTGFGLDLRLPLAGFDAVAQHSPDPSGSTDAAAGAAGADPSQSR